MKGYTYPHFLEYNNNSTPQGRHGFSYRHTRETCLMNTKTPSTKQPYYEIVRHRRGLLVRIGGKYVPNRRGRPKHFVLHKHVQQYLQKRGVA